MKQTMTEQSMVLLTTHVMHLGEALLAPTRIYVKALKSIKKAGVAVKACSHITGAGFYENVPRMLQDGVRAVIKKDSYEVPAIFKLLQEKGEFLAIKTLVDLLLDINIEIKHFENIFASFTIEQIGKETEQIPYS